MLDDTKRGCGGQMAQGHSGEQLAYGEQVGGGGAAGPRML